jgi:hypothetical protein
MKFAVFLPVTSADRCHNSEKYKRAVQHGFPQNPSLPFPPPHIQEKTMQTMESKGVVRRIIEEEEGVSVSFFEHDGYFRISPSGQMAEIKQKIFESAQNKTEIAFVHDKTLNILRIV